MKKFLAFVFILLGILIIGVLAFPSLRARVSAYLPNDISIPVPSAQIPNIKDTVDGILPVSDDVKADEDKIPEVIDFIKEKSSDGSLSSKEGIKETISEGKEKFDVEVSEEETEKIADTVSMLEDMGFSTDVIIDKVEDAYYKYGEEFTNHLEEAFVEAAEDMAQSAAQNAVDGVKEKISDIFSK